MGLLAGVLIGIIVVLAVIAIIAIFFPQVFNNASNLCQKVVGNTTNQNIKNICIQAPTTGNSSGR